MTRIYLDCDGVMADFDEAAYRILNMNPRRFEAAFGPHKFWQKLTRLEDGSPRGFFKSLDLMYDAMELYNAVSHLDPIILTGAPKEDFELAKREKIEFAHEKFGPDQKIIVCLSKDKVLYCQPGDILIDDWPKHKHIWEAAGGVWIDHRSAKYTIEALKELDVIS